MPLGWLTVALGDTPVTLQGDESRLTQVVANLLHNSAKFTDRNGRLHISLAKDEDTAIISLHDNGCGICANDLQEIFLPRCSPQSEPAGSATGLGIGLRLAKSIVDLHGGTIQAFSQGLGQGSTFVVSLPMISDLPVGCSCKPAQSISTSDSHEASLPCHRIVVVDDDRSMRFLMSRLLANLSQSVEVADSGKTAIEIIIRDQPQVVFLDLQMHGLSGYEVARQLRSRHELDGIVLVALSGSSDADSRRRAAESGFDQYLVKPTNIVELTNVLHRVGQLSNC